MALSLEELAQRLETQAQQLQAQTQELQTLRARLANLETTNSALSIPTANPAQLGRRKLLRKLGLSFLAGTTALTAQVWLNGSEAQAKVGVTLPTIGAVITPRTSTITGSLASGVTIGMLASSLPSFSLANFTADSNLGIYGTGTSVGLFGNAPTDTGIGVLGTADGAHATGVFGSSNNGAGVQGFSSAKAGVYGNSTSSYGIQGSSDNNSGVYGISISGSGVKGSSTSGEGVYGNSTNNAGVSGNSTNGPGVFGSSVNTTAIYGLGKTGVIADGAHLGLAAFSTAASFNELPSDIRIGLIANSQVFLDLASFTNHQNLGLYATAAFVNGVTSYAGVFNGNVVVTGNLAKGSLSFKIDHPLDPENQYLYHSGVESPDMMNLYNGNLKLNEQGEATVTLPDWFEALNRDFRYQLTALGSASPDLHIASQVRSNHFKIAGGEPGQEISWQVSGIRQDRYAKAHPVPVEEVKNQDEKGKYLHPEAWGHGPERGVMPAGEAKKSGS